MNPYVSATLAMCVIVIIALVATAYMAAAFNRRAKEDLDAALRPLADVINGEIDLDEAVVRGRYQGHLAEGRMANNVDGPGRVFHVSVIDGAGGAKWSWVRSNSRQRDAASTERFDSSGELVRRNVGPQVEAMMGESPSEAAWMRLEYDPAPGHVRLTAPMRTRRDLPDATRFRARLDTLVQVAAMNRAEQQPGIGSS